jgi:membrane-anchored protein YejM (alkaline phosphatase superfamily)
MCRQKIGRFKLQLRPPKRHALPYIVKNKKHRSKRWSSSVMIVWRCFSVAAPLRRVWRILEIIRYVIALYSNMPLKGELTNRSQEQSFAMML